MIKITPPRKKLVLSIVLLTVIGSYIAVAYIKPLPLITSTPKTFTGQTATAVDLPWPSYGQSAVGAVGYGVLASHGDQTALPTASIAKVMTALAVLHQKPLSLGEQGPSITMTQADVDSYNKYVAEDGSVVKVAVGDQLSEYQALQALLLPSANNIAETLARWAFDSIDAYNTYANQYAQAQHLTTVHITDPSGFLPSTVASAHDLTLLGITAMQNPVLANIVGQSTATLPTNGPISNVNVLLGQNGTVGIKTGNNDQDLGAYLFAAHHTVNGKTITIVGALMDGPDLGTVLHDSLPLITSADSGFVSTTPVHAGDTVASYHVPWQGTVNVVAQQDLQLTSWRNDTTIISVGIRTQPSTTVLPKGANVGSISVNNRLYHAVSESPMILASKIAKPSLWWRLTHVF